MTCVCIQRTYEMNLLGLRTAVTGIRKVKRLRMFIMTERQGEHSGLDKLVQKRGRPLLARQAREFPSP